MIFIRIEFSDNDLWLKLCGRFPLLNVVTVVQIHVPYLSKWSIQNPSFGNRLVIIERVDQILRRDWVLGRSYFLVWRILLQWRRLCRKRTFHSLLLLFHLFLLDHTLFIGILIILLNHLIPQFEFPILLDNFLFEFLLSHLEPVSLTIHFSMKLTLFF